MMRKVLEKFQNKKVFVLYLVGVLLLSTGISFAYFSASSSVTGSGGVATGVTATIESEGVQADGNISFSNTDIYPGHQAVASIKVTGRGENEPIIFNVIFNGSNTFKTPINYTIYKTEENIDASYNCSVKEERVGINIIYYEECTGSNIDSLGSPINSGTITKGEGKTILKSDEIILTEPEGKEVYYYVVFEYPNEDDNQNDDIGSTIKGNITIEEGGQYNSPNVMFVGTTTSGNNGWYKSVSLTSNITTQTGNYDVSYCITTEESCTPNETASIIDNSFTTILNSNANPQKLCVRITDEYNQVGEGCSEAYKVDGENPTISITNTSATENSISVTVSGSDAYSGITQYRFSSDNGSNYVDIDTSDNSYTYTFNNLEAGTSYNISVQAVDDAGNVNTVSQAIETEKPGNTMSEIIAGYNIGNRGSFSGAYTQTTTKTVFQTTDWAGTSYYFAGQPTDNWVQFGGYYWRIIRVNGDGSTRLIYNGTSTATTGAGTQLDNTSAFNTNYFQSEYVGLKYTLGQQHGQNSNSTIYEVLNSWYNSSLLEDYGKYIDNTVGFCSDRNLDTSRTASWSSKGTLYYAAYKRISDDVRPILTCSNNDIIKVSIGLITADEALFGGIPNLGSTRQNYLYTGLVYWTMTPSNFGRSESRAAVYVVNEGANLGANGGVNRSSGVRPVINLKTDTRFTGSGTSTDPYTVVE